MSTQVLFVLKRYEDLSGQNGFMTPYTPTRETQRGQNGFMDFGIAKWDKIEPTFVGFVPLRNLAPMPSAEAAGVASSASYVAVLEQAGEESDHFS